MADSIYHIQTKIDFIRTDQARDIHALSSYSNFHSTIAQKLLQGRDFRLRLDGGRRQAIQMAQNNVHHLIKRCAIFMFLMLAGCQKETPSMDSIMETHSKCTTKKGDLLIYNTAAGFSISRPVWMSNSALVDQFTTDCKLTYTKLSFAIIQGALIPIPQPGLEPEYGHKRAKQPPLPERFDKLTLMLRFKDPRSDGPGMPELTCKAANKIHTIHKMPEFGIQMCEEGSSPNIKSLPFYPRFEFIDSPNGNPSMTCRHQDFDGVTIENIGQLTAIYCRGYWTWRPGAHAMFDIERGEVLKKFRPAIEAAESTLNSWVVTNDHQATKP
jgi:hypothetical protein